MLCVCFRDEKKRSWFHCLYTNLSPWEVSCLLCSISDCPLNKKLKGLDQGHILKNVIIRFSNKSRNTPENYASVPIECVLDFEHFEKEHGS